MPAKPDVPADAQVTFNEPGKAWFAALTAWGEGVARQFTDAASACHAAQKDAGAQ